MNSFFNRKNIFSYYGKGGVAMFGSIFMLIFTFVALGFTWKWADIMENMADELDEICKK